MTIDRLVRLTPRPCPPELLRFLEALLAALQAATSDEQRDGLLAELRRTSSA